ncbi:MAG TPA: CopG family transcriptional regulator [Tissierellaceae bacterium]
MAAETKRVLAGLPNGLLKEVELMVPVESNSVIESVTAYVNERNKLIEMLKVGYEEMSQINLDYAELGLEQDIIDLVYYEANLKRAGML